MPVAGGSGFAAVGPSPSLRRDVRRTSRGLVALLLLAVAVPAAGARAQTVLDETVAIVNGELIAKSDVLWNLALAADVSPEDFWKSHIQRSMLESVLDQTLLLQEAATLPAIRVSDEEVDERIKAISDGFVSADDPDRFVRRQALVGLTRDRFEEIVRDRLRIEKFVDFRFKSFVVVTEAELDRFFETEIRPTLVERGLVVTDQEKARLRPEAERGVVEEKTNAAIEAYLASARDGAEIVYFRGWGAPPAADRSPDR
jgi:hypothetical protein